REHGLAALCLSSPADGRSTRAGAGAGVFTGGSRCRRTRRIRRRIIIDAVRSRTAAGGARRQRRARPIVARKYESARPAGVFDTMVGVFADAGVAIARALAVGSRPS